jgi:diphosphomevalonate decarboxylase
MRKATAIANANIALAKYWGKRAYAGNYPAVPSLSVTLSVLATTTTVLFDEVLARDEFALDCVEQKGKSLDRVVALLDRVRRSMGSPCFARVVSVNNFPTASGLASSASGFAALAAAALRAAGLDWDLSQVSDLARRSSASAARSVYGGYVSLAAGPKEDCSAALSAEPIAGHEALDLRVLVCVVTEGKKSKGSTEAMQQTASQSPFYPTWLDLAPVQYASIRDSLVRGDFESLGEAAEASALAMHASAFAAGIVYGSDATFALIAKVRALRAGGIAAFVTMDAGPHVKVLVKALDVARVRAVLEKSAMRVIEAAPSPDGVRVYGPEGTP